MSSLHGLRPCLPKSVIWRTSDVEKEPDTLKFLLGKGPKHHRACREAQLRAAEQRNEQHQPDPTSFAPTKSDTDLPTAHNTRCSIAI